jgi:hypothetical protein
MTRAASFATRTCRLCDERFEPTNGRQRYGSVKHWGEHRQGTPNVRECRCCGEPFTPTSPNQRLCTAEHRDRHNRVHRPPSTTAGWRERVDQLEAELTDPREQLADREVA